MQIRNTGFFYNNLIYLNWKFITIDLPNFILYNYIFFPSVPSLNICSTFPPQQFVSLPNSIDGGGGSLCGGDRYSVLSEPIFSTRSQVATCQLRPASPFLRQSSLCGTALADIAVQCSRAAPLAYRRPTLVKFYIISLASIFVGAVHSFLSRIRIEEKTKNTDKMQLNWG